MWDGGAIVVELVGGTDSESDADLRSRVLERIQRPPMGGDADDYVQWTLSVPGVTRGARQRNGHGHRDGALHVRRAARIDRRLPDPSDIVIVANYLDTVRPVAVRDFFVEAPILEPINFTLHIVSGDNLATREAIEESVAKMLANARRTALRSGRSDRAAKPFGPPGSGSHRALSCVSSN